MQRFSYAIAFFFILSSCSDNSKNDLVAYRMLKEGLDQSNEKISSSNEYLYKVFEDRLSDARSNENIQIWQPKAVVIKKLSDDIIKYVTGLKKELLDEGGLDYDNDLNVVHRLFFDNARGEELYKQLVNYRRNILSVDSNMNYEFEKKINIITRNFDISGNNPEKFTNYFFDKIPAIAAIAMLSRFENNIKIVEHDCINYCYLKTSPIYNCGYEPIRVLLTQSSTIVKPGEVIEITSGVGAFSYSAQPELTVNGRKKNGEGGVVTYKLKTSDAPGDYTVPVKLEFIQPDGTKESFIKNIRYKVIDTAKNK